MADPNRSWALRLAEAGMAIFPCGPDKRPLDHLRWRAVSTTDANQLAQWWHQSPNALPAIDLAKSDLVVLDGDRHGGPDGRAALRELLQQKGCDTRGAPIVLTPGDGVHVYFKQNGHALGNSSGDLPDGIDVRGQGGYVIAYAVMPDARQYKAARNSPDLIAAFQAGTIPHVPQPIVDLIRAPKRKTTTEQPHSKPANTAASFGDTREQAWAGAALDGCAAELAAMGKDSGRNIKLNALAFRLGRMIARGWLDRTQVETVLTDAMHTNGYVGEEGDPAVRATLRSGIDAGTADPHPDLTDREDHGGGETGNKTGGGGNSTSQSTAAADKPTPLPFINLAALQNKRPQEREWVAKNRIPLKNVTLLSGEGGTGKSILALHCGVATALERDWLGTLPNPGPVLIVCCEDDVDELHRRLDHIVEHYGTRLVELSKKMHVVSLAGMDAVMAVPEKSGLIIPTKLFKQVHEAACDIRPRLIVIDNSADVYAGNENDRAQVRQFITLLRGTAIASSSGLVLTSHPSLTGISSGSGLSGSTAWNASVRSRLYFKRATTDKDEEPDPELRVLEVMKSNYGPVGETITLRWKDGLFLPANSLGGLDKLAAEQRANEAFLTLLAQFDGQGRNVSDKPTAPTYAPAMFSKEPGAKGIRKADLADAMRRLFAANRIHVGHYGRPSRPYSKLVVGACP